VAHGGDISGFNSYYALYPEQGLAVIVLSNVGMRPAGSVPDAGNIAHRIVEMLLGDHLGPQWPVVVAVPGATLDRYVGTYRLEAPAPVAAPKLPDLKDRAYCGLICDNSCPLFKATKANDPVAKKTVFEKWKWKETYGIEFDPNQVFCHGCKAPGKPENVAHTRYTVLKCCVGRKLESCLPCGKLAGCDKDLWKNWPDFKKQIEKLQRDYVAAGRFELS